MSTFVSADHKKQADTSGLGALVFLFALMTILGWIAFLTHVGSTGSFILLVASLAATLGLGVTVAIRGTRKKTD